ncbi:tandem-95 repeat protein [Candidatus Marinimicrobia bacterium]|nr:tandem-95 repeat protein [Candidatus Neomarinimicrobiota bacterium]
MISIYKNNYSFHLFNLLLILNSSLLFSSNCNDNSALNFNQSSNSNIECVYFDIPSLQQTDEDIDYEIDLLSFSSGNENEISNLSFSVDCSNISYIESCVLSDTYLTVVLIDNYDSTTDVIDLTITYDISDDLLMPIIKSDSFYISVNAINDPPQIDSNNNLQASINNLFEYVVEVSDVDNDAFTFSLTDNPFGVQLIAHSSIAIVSYTPSDTDNFINCFGDEECFSFTIQTSDNGNPSLSTSENFLIKIVSNDNVLPIITVLDIDNYNEDELITIYFNIDDDDISITDLTFLCIYSRLGSTNNQYHEVSSGNNVSDYKVVFQPFNNWNGEFEIKIIADDQSSFITYTLTLDLAPVNDIPIISNYQNISFNEGDYDNITPYLRNIYLVDSDQNSFANENPFNFADIGYTLIWHGDNIDGVDSNENQNISSEFSRNGSSNTVFNYFYTQDADWYGTEYFEVIVDDGESGPVSRVFPVTINNINDAPVLIDIEDQIINEDSNIILTIIANDIDSDNLFYTMTGNHASYLFNDNILTITPDDNYYGNLDLSINVSDGDLSTNDSFTLTILSINDLPYTEDLNSILNEDDAYHLINMNGTIIDDLCNSEILNASDNSTVCNCNDLQEGACDIEDINLSFKLYSNVSNGNLYLDIDNSLILNENDLLLNSKVYYDPESDFFGLDEFVYEVCDQELACSLGTVNLIINASNDIPSIDNEANSITINEDNITSLINIIASDIDGDDLTYSIRDVPSAGLLFKDLDNQNSVNLKDQLDGSMLYYTPNLNFNGEDSFSFRVSDGISSNEGVYNIIILPVNDNPIANEIEGSIEIVEDTPVLISLSGSDVDEDTLQFIMVSLPNNGTITNDEGMQLDINSIISENTNSDGYLTNLTYTPYLNWIGEDTFSFMINDMQGEDNSLSNIMEVNIIVSQINDTPILNCPDGNCNLLLSDINAIYEDCSPIESDSNIACDSVDGIIIEDLRVFYNSSSDICSSNHLWYDIDCYNSIDPEDFDFGIAIDMSSAIDDFDSNIGSWKYKKQCAEGYIDLTSSLAATCNFLLLDHMDELFFRPNDNYHTTADIQTFPSIVFHAWDKTEYVNAGDVINESCVTSLLNSSSFSESSITASVEVLSVNDNPIANEIEGSIEIVEDTPVLISLSGSDVDEDTLQFIMVSLPNNGTITNDEGMQLDINSIISENTNSDGYLTNLTYTPYLNWIGEDTFSFMINDMQGEDNSLSNIMEVNIIVSQINDTPILNCPDGNCNLLLSDINAIYEDCSPIESDSNIACDSVDGIIIEDLRVFYNSSSDICSSNHLWYDIDCYNSIDPEDFDFGIAIDMSSAIDDFDSNIGSWKYKKQGAEGYIDLTSSLAATCNFLLLDHMDELFFRPNDNYHTTADIQTFPSIVFHAWDKTEYVNAGDVINESCVTSLLNSSSFSESSITASVEVLSVNDTPHSNILDLEPSYKEFCPQQDNPSCNETGIYEILIEFTDLLDSNGEIYSDDMFFYVSSTTISENSQQSLFSNIPFNINPYDPTNFINQSSGDVIEKRGNELYLKLNLIEYVNGSAEITIVGYDRENFDEGLFTEQTFIFVVEQVNNKINQFEIIPNIGLYEDYNDKIINNDIMLYPYNFTNEDDLYIKYPPYIYNNNIITVNDINADNFLAVQEFMIENPPNMGEIYFMWNRNLDTYLDYDIDEMLNAEPYNLYYRLEFIDSDNNIFVLKDSILENFTNLENAYTKIKFSKGPFKKYKNGDIYNPESIPNQEALIDTTGLTFYNWRIVADNYQTSSQDINTEYDFYNTKSELSENAYAINLIIPKFNYDFSINDIYPNYFDLYLSPVPTNFLNSFSNNYEFLTLNQNSEIYIDYPNNNLDEVLNADFLDFPNNEQNIFLVNDDINQFGPCVFFAPIQNSVGNINISKTEVNFNQVIPNVFNTIESSSQDFSVQFNPNNQFNMIIYEREYNEIMLNDSNLDILSNLFIIKANNTQAPKARINYILNSNLEDVSNVTFCRYDNGSIEKISSKINNGILSADIEKFGSFLVIFDSISSDNEIPLQTSLLSCFPNPFNPSTIINYFLSKESDIRFKVFNVKGQVVFISDKISAKSGYNNYQWSALDSSGNLLPSGIYIISMSSNNEFFTKKITLLK